MLIDRATYDSFDGTLEQRVADFAAALLAHSDTVDEPAPTEHPLVEAVARAGGMDAVEIAPPSPPLPEPAPPGPIRSIRPLAFRRRLSVETREVITAAAMASASIRTFLDDLGASQLVELDDAEVVAGVATLQSASLITEDEASALLADGTSAET